MAEYYDNLPPVADFIGRYGLAAKKSLGQNFILDLNLTDRIARAVPDLADSVMLEVGPGPGALTRALLKNGALGVVAIEFDGRAIGALEEIGRAYPGRLEIINADAMETGWRAIKEKFAPRSPLRICANLPYNISMPLLVGWLRCGIWDSMTLMFQLEVGRRIVAGPGSKDYGRISILAALASRARLLFRVAPSNFHPRPKVDSCIVGFEKLGKQPGFCAESSQVHGRREPDGAGNGPAAGFHEISKVEEVAKAAFSMRRKMLRSTLAPLFGDRAEMEFALSDAGIDPSARAEDIAPEKYLALARLLLAE